MRRSVKDKIVEIAQQGIVRLLGHSLRKTDDKWMKQAWNTEVESTGRRGSQITGMMEKKF